MPEAVPDPENDWPMKEPFPENWLPFHLTPVTGTFMPLAETVKEVLPTRDIVVVVKSSILTLAFEYFVLFADHRQDPTVPTHEWMLRSLARSRLLGTTAPEKKCRQEDCCSSRPN